MFIFIVAAIAIGVTIDLKEGKGKINPFKDIAKTGVSKEQYLQACGKGRKKRSLLPTTAGNSFYDSLKSELSIRGLCHEH